MVAAALQTVASLLMGASAPVQALDSLLGDFSGALQQAGGFPLCWTLDFYYFDYNRSFTRGETDIRSGGHAALRS